ncbi:MAG: hypothetical protein AB1485_00110 [Candidatus Thermoplasmatota archaeon]
MSLKDAVEEIVKSVTQNVQQEIEKRLSAIVDEKLAEAKEEIVESVKEKVIEAIVLELTGKKPALAPKAAVKPITLTKIDVLGHTPIYRELLDVIGEFGKGKTFTRGELFSHMETKFAGLKFWKDLTPRTKLDYLNRHLSYLKRYELAALERKHWSVVPGVRAGLTNIFAKIAAEKEEVKVKKEKKPGIKLAELTRVDTVEKRPVYKEVIDSIIMCCTENALKRSELLQKLEEKLSGTEWINFSPASRKSYLTTYLGYLKNKGALKLENLRWSAMLDAS